MNYVDLFVLLWIVVHLALGTHYGLAKQVTHMIALIGASGGAYWGGESFARMASGLVDFPIPFQGYLGSAVLCLLLYVTIRLLLLPFRKFAEMEGTRLAQYNRLLGGVSAGSFALFFAYLLICTTLWVDLRTDRSLSLHVPAIRRSTIFSWVEQNNVVHWVTEDEKRFLRLMERGMTHNPETNRSSKQADSVDFFPFDEEVLAAMASMTERLDKGLYALIQKEQWKTLADDGRIFDWLDSKFAIELAIDRAASPSVLPPPI